MSGPAQTIVALPLLYGCSIILAADAGEVVLQLQRQVPGTPQDAAALSVRLTPPQCEHLCDALTGVACMAEEWTFEVDLAAAYAAAGIPAEQSRELIAKAMGDAP